VRIRSVAALAPVVLACAGCGQSQTSTVPDQGNAGPSLPGAPALHGHPQAIEPTAGAAAQSAGGSASAGATGPAGVSVGPSTGPLAQPASDAQIRRELAASGLSANANQATLTPSGLALAPVDAPAAVQAIIAAGNQIAHLPYVWGGGHGRYIDTGYDCSGSLSFVFAAAGILNTTVTSGELVNWGSAGAGKWITVFANNGHTFMYVAGLRFDTVALAETGTRWSNRPANEPDLKTFAIRHPVGL
jgi:cell wall-associated NlpC family hydrolase